MEPAWKAVAAMKKKQRDSRIRPEWIIDAAKYSELRNVTGVPSECGILTERELRITADYDAVDLVERIRDAKLTVEEVVTAFCKRAAVAQQLTNCLTEIMFEEAIETAKQMDLDRKQNPTKPLPPLYGLPISLKDGFHVPGFDATLGFISLADNPSEVYSALPRLLKQLGAVFHCKTNVPQTLIAGDCDNNVFGRTVNPHNTSLSPAGSSGGEGALVAMRGSVLGVGTDLGGSVRMPAACNGVYGFKPSAGIIPFAGQQSPVTPGMIGVMPAAGPLATSVRACAFFMEVVMRAEPWKSDVSCLHLPWTGWRPKSEGPLRIGFIEDNGMHTPSPPIRRAIREAGDALRLAGHELVPIHLQGVPETVKNIIDLYGLDGVQASVDLLNASGEPKVPAVQMLNVVGQPAKSLQEAMRLNFSRMVACATYGSIWSRYGVDFLLTPAASHTAIPPDRWTSFDYTALYNYLDWPGIVLPFGKVQESDARDNAAKYGQQDEEVYRLYTGPADYADAPTSVQLVGQPQEDEKLIWYAGAVDRILNRV